METHTTEAAVEQMPPVLETAEGSTEEITELEQQAEAPQPAPKKKIRQSIRAVGTGEPPASALQRDLQTTENQTLRDIVAALGTGTSLKVSITRTAPSHVSLPNGQRVECTGHLAALEGPTVTDFDEEYLRVHHGGGSYTLRFHVRQPNGTWRIATTRSVVIAGQPMIDSVAAVTPAPQPQGDAPSVVTRALEMAEATAKRAEERANRRPDEGDSAAFKMLEASMRRAEREADELRKELRALSERKPEGDQFKDTLIHGLMGGETTRIQAMRDGHERELRVLKENARDDEKRSMDRHERMIQDMRNAHEREISLIRTTQASEINALKSSFETSVSALKSSFETTTRLSDGENKRLSADNAELRSEVAALRAKKDVGPMEMFKTVREMKEVLTGDDDDEEKGGLGATLMNLVTPETIGAFSGLIRGPQTAVPPQMTAHQAQQQLAPKRRVAMIEKDGRQQKVIIEPDGSVSAMPERRKQAPAPGEMPDVDPKDIERAVSLLEHAFQGQQDPAIVAQSARSMIPEGLLAVIRAHGIDAVMTKMAKLPSNSPFSTLAGRKWLRRLSEALVGEPAEQETETPPPTE